MKEHLRCVSNLAEEQNSVKQEEVNGEVHRQNQNRGEQSKGLEAISQIIWGLGRTLHWWGGVAHHVVVVRWWAVTL